jgi:hypothetical protein
LSHDPPNLLHLLCIWDYRYEPPCLTYIIERRKKERKEGRREREKEATKLLFKSGIIM